MFFKHLLVVVDGSETSQYAVGAGITLSREDRSPITFCVTIDPELTADVGMACFAEMAQTLAQRFLDEALARARAAGLTDATALIVTDEPAAGVVALARERAAGLIVLGVAPRVGFLRPFMRDLATEILRETTIPLCVMRRPAKGWLSRKILVPIVDDELSRVATRYALSLAYHFHSTVLFCTLARGSSDTAAHELVERAKSVAAESGIAAEAFLLPVSGGISSAIVENAQLHGCDSIVMASHMREGFPRLVQGSVTEAVIHSSNVPVVMVRLGCQSNS